MAETITTTDRLRAWPRVVQVGLQVDLTLDGGPCVLQPGTEYGVRWFSMVNRAEDISWTARSDSHGRLVLPVRFTCPGEYRLSVTPPGNDAPVRTEHFFCTDDARANLRPFKGDTHVHTSHSDGRKTPWEMARQGRAVGLDFLALTDHDTLNPNRDIIEHYAANRLSPLLLQGEEVTVRGPGGHLVALGDHEEIDDVRRRAAYESEVAALAETLQSRQLPAPLTPQDYAHVLWTARRIRQSGALLVLAHPYWKGTTGKYYPPRQVVDLLLQDGLVDAVELMGGSPSTEDNHLCVARHLELALTGRRMPVVGGSDAHEPEELGRKFTLLFAPELDARQVREGILDLRTVACARYPCGDVAVFGAFHLVEYAYFLLREYFPLHDALCAQQAAFLPAEERDATEEPDAPYRVLQDKLSALRRDFWHEAETTVSPVHPLPTVADCGEGGR